MEAISGQVAGPITVTEDTVIYGQISGDVTVCGGVVFVLNGQITGDLRVEPGAKASVHGVVQGVTYAEGDLEEFGTFIGGVKRS